MLNELRHKETLFFYCILKVQTLREHHTATLTVDYFAFSVLFILRLTIEVANL